MFLGYKIKIFPYICRYSNQLNKINYEHEQ
nr:MAG TPA: hypothetical protein [Caudoviricetes sp.]